MTIRNAQIETEIHDIHDFFTDWVGGRCPGDSETFERNALDRIADDLVVIMPGGAILGKPDFAGYMKSIYGSNPDFRIKIRDIRVRHHRSGVAVVNYQEWQRDAKQSAEPNNGRVTTMILRERGPGLAHEILLVHETWLPASLINAGDFEF